MPQYKLPVHDYNQKAGNKEETHYAPNLLISFTMCSFLIYFQNVLSPLEKGVIAADLYNPESWLETIVRHICNGISNPPHFNRNRAWNCKFILLFMTSSCHHQREKFIAISGETLQVQKAYLALAVCLAVILLSDGLTGLAIFRQKS